MELPRDRHLFSHGPKRILSLDGGGVRGIVSIAFLERIEQVLRLRYRRPDLRLAEYYDLIGGVSTGGIIATALALGWKASEVRDFYFRLAPVVFEKPRFKIPLLSSRFDKAGLERIIRAEVGDMTLDDPRLLTGLALIAKRIDTGSVWLIANNPRGKFWNGSADGRHIGMRHFPLAQVMRASAAAPLFFEPEAIALAADGERGLFVDGGVTPYNNPSLMLLLMAWLNAYGLGWPKGADGLLLHSVGTGGFRPLLSAARASRMSALELGLRSLASMIQDSHVQSLMLLQLLSEPRAPWPINGELGTLAGETLVDTPMLNFARLDIRIEAEWLRDTLDIAVAPRLLSQMRAIDNPAVIRDLHALALEAAVKVVDADHFPPAFAPLP